MEVRIQSIHFDASEQLQSFVQKKVAKLEKFYDDIKKVEVSLKVVKPETAENKEAGVKVLVPNGEFYANKVCDTFEEAVDLCLEALEKQLVKYKEKQPRSAANRPLPSSNPVPTPARCAMRSSLPVSEEGP